MAYRPVYGGGYGYRPAYGGYGYRGTVATAIGPVATAIGALRPTRVTMPVMGRRARGSLRRFGLTARLRRSVVTRVAFIQVAPAADSTAVILAVVASMAVVSAVVIPAVVASMAVVSAVVIPAVVAFTAVVSAAVAFTAAAAVTATAEELAWTTTGIGLG